VRGEPAQSEVRCHLVVRRVPGRDQDGAGRLVAEQVRHLVRLEIIKDDEDTAPGNSLPEQSVLAGLTRRDLRHGDAECHQELIEAITGGAQAP
jgi:hypothetical protein